MQIDLFLSKTEKLIHFENGYISILSCILKLQSLFELDGCILDEIFEINLFALGIQDIIMQCLEINFNNIRCSIGVTGANSSDFIFH